MFRKPLFFVIALGGFLSILGGCSSGPSIAGTWTTGEGATATTMVAKPDGSYTVTNDGKSNDGTWRTDGSTVTLYQDLRNGGTPAQFGGSWDGSFTYQLDASGTSMTSVPPNTGTQVPTVTLHKKV